MGQIIGNTELIKESKAAQPGDLSNLVNWDALERIPDLYDGQVVQVKFNIPKSDKDPGDFAPVGGGTYQPNTDLMNKIAEARGITGLDFGEARPLVNLVDWNRMILDFNAPPKMISYMVGYIVSKRGSVLTADGTPHPCDPCVVVFNVWERCCEAWSAEEKGTEGYTKLKTYPSGDYYYEVSSYGKTYKNSLKYDNRFKRQAHFDSEMKFAERKADTKARNVVTRTLSGMPTGYKIADLQKGYFLFGKIVRSNFAIKSEHAANLNRIAQGHTENDASKKLFGNPKKALESANIPEPPQPPEPADTVRVEPANLAQQASEPVIDKSFVQNALSQYLKEGLVAKEQIDNVTALIDWIKATDNPEGNANYWNKTLGLLTEVEKSVPSEKRWK